MNAGLEDIFSKFEPITLAGYEAAGLLRRSEQKFLIRESALPALMDSMKPGFRILSEFGKCSFRYETDYFDTPGFRSYHDHLRDAPDRIKLRIRRYLNAGTVMLELKKKGGNGRISKTRMELPSNASFEKLREAQILCESFEAEAADFSFSLQTRYRRTSFMSIDCRLRVSIDTNIEASSSAGNTVSFPGLAVIEVKAGERPGASASSRAKIRACGGIRTPFSKYMAGMSLLYPELRNGILAPRNLILSKLQIIPRFS